jgi:hypothetical protein
MADTLALYDRLIATLPGVERKGKKIPYTSLNGHMFSQITDEGEVALRLPPDQVPSFLARHRTRNHVAHGALRPEYVIVPQRLLAKTAEAKKYFAQSLAYVASLKPKPTTRKKK